MKSSDKELRVQASKVIEINIYESIPDHKIRERVFEVIPKSDYRKFLKDFRKPNLSRDFTVG